VKALKINDSVHIKNLALPEGVKCLLPADEVVVAVHPPREEEVAPAVEEAATQPEVIEKGKKEKEGEEGATAAPKAGAAAPKAAAAPSKEAK
jgi:large subunit ribosomal protein L25